MIEILFENDNFLAINKPAGLVVHSDGRTKEQSVADWILENYPKLKEVGEPWQDRQGNVIFRPGIVHRLDRDTSGVMLIAKNQNYFNLLKEQFQNHQIQKTYLAFVYGEIKPDDGIIDKAIGRSPSDFRRWLAGRGARGTMREAITNYKTLWRSKDVSFLELKPKTGRTHQLRVHLKYFNHPIIADQLYASNQIGLLDFTRTALHSYNIEFNDGGQNFNITAPLPNDFIHAKKLLQIS